MKNRKFNIVAIILIIIFCVAISPITMQNDTYYTIAIGKHIEENGIDMQDPFSWHKDLPYTYPHWLYDLSIYKIYSTFETIGLGFEAIYASTVILTIILGILLYRVNSKLAKNNVVSFVITIGVIYCLKDFIAARAQLVTFILFVLTIYFIEKFLENKKIRYALGLVIIPILIANLHAAVWPFYFVLYLPYIAEYLISIIFKKNSKKEDVYKVYIERNTNTKWLILIMLICLLTGFCTPLGKVPYTYLVYTMKGNTTKNISEHLPMTLINNIPVLCAIGLVIIVLTFSKSKIKLRDLFMIGGLAILMLYSRRQETMFVLIGSIILNKLIIQIVENKESLGKEKLENISGELIPLIIITLIIIALSIIQVKEKINDKFVNDKSYPVNMSEYILNYCKENDIENMRLYNEYNYGSYLLFKGIPVFIDSRADLYTPEFNTNTKDSKDGQDIFSDFIDSSNLNIFYEEIFKKYDITHVILYKNSKMNLVISNTNDGKYKLLNQDDNFVFYEIVK